MFDDHLQFIFQLTRLSYVKTKNKQKKNTFSHFSQKWLFIILSLWTNIDFWTVLLFFLFHHNRQQPTTTSLPTLLRPKHEKKTKSIVILWVIFSHTVKPVIWPLETLSRFYFHKKKRKKIILVDFFVVNIEWR